MTGEYFSSLWAAIAPGVANHLWQSTLFAISGGLLTLFLRKHHAKARHWLWLAASLKFLLPFSLLVGIGSRLSTQPADAPAVRPVVYFAVEEITQPFSQLGVRVTPDHVPSMASSILPELTQVIGALWLVGFLAVLVLWCVRWRRVSAATKHAVPLQEGREVEVLRRMERIGGIRRPLAMLLSRTSLEPGIFGIARPVLVWPEGISQHLDDTHLEAILAHELGHVRRRDNLAAAIHMLVEAIFWFYPLVWWMGARLLEERERACDEEVLEMGSERQVYAESILKTCEFCVEAPLACVSGVTGADLKRRIVRIMSERVAERLGFGKRLLLLTICSTAVAVPVVLGLANSPPRLLAQLQEADGPAVQPFEVATIKPSRPGDNMVQLFMSPGKFTTKGETLKGIIKFAY